MFGNGFHTIIMILIGFGEFLSIQGTNAKAKANPKANLNPIFRSSENLFMLLHSTRAAQSPGTYLYPYYIGVSSANGTNVQDRRACV